MRASSEGRTEFLVMLVEAGVNIDLQNEVCYCIIDPFLLRS